MDTRLDAVVIGTGPAGEVAVSRLAGQGRRVALVERELRPSAGTRSPSTATT